MNHMPLYTNASKAFAGGYKVTFELYLWSTVPYVNYACNYLFIKT